MIKTGIKKILVILILLLGACDDNNTQIKRLESGLAYWKECIEGKEFIVGFRRLSINLDFDGKPIKCEVQDD